MERDKLKAYLNEVIEENPTINVLKSDVAELKADVAELKADVAELKADVAELKADVAELKADVAELKSDVAIVKSDITELKQNQLELGLRFEDMQRDLKLILDAVIPAQQRAAKVDQVASQMENHEYRISALEIVVTERKN